MSETTKARLQTGAILVTLLIAIGLLLLLSTAALAVWELGHA